MTRQDLINTLRQGHPVTAKLVKEILAQLDMAGHMEANLKFYQAEVQRLEDVLAKMEE